MTTELLNRRVTLTTKYSSRTCCVIAHGFRNSSKKPWTFYINERAARRAERKICGEGDVLMLTQEAAAKIGADEIDVISDEIGKCRYAVLGVKR